MRRYANRQSKAAILASLLLASVPARGQETRFAWEDQEEKKVAQPAAAEQKPATAAAKSAAPKPVATKPTSKVRPPAGPPPATSVIPIERVEKIEEALRKAGLLEDGSAAHAEDVRTEIHRLEQQQKGLETAVANGVAIAGIEQTLSDLKQRVEALRAELAELEKRSAGQGKTAAPAQVDTRVEALDQRLDAVETHLNERARRAEPATPKVEEAPSKEPEPAKEPASDEEPALESGYDDGFILRSSDGVYTLVPNGFLQVLLSYRTAGDDPAEVAFSLPRARAGFKGTVFSKDFKYNFFADFGKGVAQLNYFYGDYTFTKDYAGVRIGLFKRPFSRAVLTGSDKQEFVSPPLTYKAFGDDHDIGVMLHNGTPMFEYSAGVFNGTGSKSTIEGDAVVDPATGEGSVEATMSNVPEQFHPMIVTRIAYNHGGIKGYSQGDLEGGPLRFSLGTGGVADLDVDDDGQSFVRGTIDGVVKAHGFSASAAALVSSRQAGDGFGDRAYDASGFVLQAGQVLAERYEPALRYTYLHQDALASATNEVAAVFNWYFEGHDLKWQTELNYVTGGEDASLSDWGALTQFQFGF